MRCIPEQLRLASAEEKLADIEVEEVLRERAAVLKQQRSGKTGFVDMLDEAIALLTGADQNDLADRLTAQREKFFFTSLAGVPLANKTKKAATKLSTDGSDANVAAVADLVNQIEDKADAPGTVLT